MCTQDNDQPYLPGGYVTSRLEKLNLQSGQRQVQYFDKARMEINEPGGDSSSRFYVTNGLLVVELIGGRVQTGDQQFEPTPRPPSDYPVAGDIDSPDALTYASLGPVASLNNNNRAPDRTGQPVSATLDRSGQVSPVMPS